MSGFDNEVLYADNWDYRGVQPVVAQVTSSGQLPIGSGGSPAIKVGQITSPGGSVTVGYSDPNITLEAGAAVPTTFTTDSGSAVPAVNNLNVLGDSGSKTFASGSTLTVRSPPFQNEAANTTVTLNSGSFATAAITLTTPATAGLTDGDLVQFIASNGVLVIQMNTGQVGHLGTATTSSGGTFTGTATGDSLSLRWQASTSDWWATSSIGVWVLA